MSLSSVLWLVLQILYLEFVCMTLYIWMLLWLSVIPQNLDEKKKSHIFVKLIHNIVIYSVNKHNIPYILELIRALFTFSEG